MCILGIFKIAADAKKKSEEPKMDDNADPSAGIMNVSICNNTPTFIYTKK